MAVCGYYFVQVKGIFHRPRPAAISEAIFGVEGQVDARRGMVDSGRFLGRSVDRSIGR